MMAFFFFLSNSWENKQFILFNFPPLTDESEMQISSSRAGPGTMLWHEGLHCSHPSSFTVQKISLRVSLQSKAEYVERNMFYSIRLHLQKVMLRSGICWKEVLNFDVKDTVTGKTIL